MAKQLRATAVKKVTLTVEVSAGPFGEEWNVGAMDKDVTAAMQNVVSRLREAAAKAGIRLGGIEVHPGCTVHVAEDKS